MEYPLYIQSIPYTEQISLVHLIYICQVSYWDVNDFCQSLQENAGIVSSLSHGYPHSSLKVNLKYLFELHNLIVHTS